MDQKTLIIQTKLEHDNDFLFKCVLLLFERQEEDEQRTKATRHQNGVGFNKADGYMLATFAGHVKLEDWEAIADRIDDARKRMLKYAGQLSGIIQDIDKTC